MAGCNSKKAEPNESDPASNTDGRKYVNYDERTGDEAVVYFTRNLSAEGLIAAYEKVNQNIEGKVAVKLHTGEKNGPNILPREWVKALMEKDLKDATIVETNHRPAPRDAEGERMDVLPRRYHGCRGHHDAACQGRKVVQGDVGGQDLD